MEARRPSFLKRKFIVDYRLQLTLLIYTVAVSFISITLARYRVYFPDSEFADGVFENASHHVIGVVFTAMTFALVVFANILLTNRIAGPIHRLKKHMERVSTGEGVEPIKFRDNDQFKDLADIYNQLLEKRLGVKASEEKSNPS